MMLKATKLMAAIIMVVFIYTPKSSGANQFQIELSQSQYLTGSDIDLHQDRYSYVIPSFDYFNESGRHIYGMSALARLSMGNDNEGYVAVPEAFYLYQGQTYGLTIGRRKFSWSRFDSLWSLGLWNPLFKPDYLNAQEQGLVAVATEKADGNFTYRLAVTPIHIPDNGPSFKTAAGKITSTNRWFRPPVSQAEIEYGEANIKYNLKLPEVNQVINNIGYSLFLGYKTPGLWSTLAYTYKPENQFHLAIETKGVHDIASSDVNPILHPVVVYHHLTNLEVGQDLLDKGWWLSLSSEVPVKPDVPAEWEQTPLVSSYFLGAHNYFHLDWFAGGKLSFSYLKNGVYKSPSGKLSIVNGKLSSSLQRFPFEEAVSIGLEGWLLRRSNYQIKALSKYTYSIVDEGALLSAQLDLNYSNRWTWYLGFDVIGFSSKVQEQQKGFFWSYQANDRIQGGLKYVF